MLYMESEFQTCRPIMIFVWICTVSGELLYHSAPETNTFWYKH